MHKRRAVKLLALLAIRSFFFFCQFNETDRDRHSFRFTFLQTKTRNLIHHFRFWFWWLETHAKLNPPLLCSPYTLSPSLSFFFFFNNPALPQLDLRDTVQNTLYTRFT
jgi:hypothetical protein